MTVQLLSAESGLPRLSVTALLQSMVNAEVSSLSFAFSVVGSYQPAFPKNAHPCEHTHTHRGQCRCPRCRHPSHPPPMAIPSLGLMAWRLQVCSLLSSPPYPEPQAMWGLPSSLVGCHLGGFLPPSLPKSPRAAGSISLPGQAGWVFTKAVAAPGGSRSMWCPSREVTGRGGEIMSSVGCSFRGHKPLSLPTADLLSISHFEH